MDYLITKRERTNFLDERGVAVDGYRVFFRLEDGTTDYVEIPKELFGKDSVESAIEELALLHADLLIA